MGKRGKKRDKVAVAESRPATHNPFAAALAGLSAPAGEALVEEVDSARPQTALPSVRTRLERKGRGGKTVTLVTGLEGRPTDEIDGLAKRLRKALGTGVSREEGVLVVQGDQRGRVEEWFDAQAEG